MFNPLERFTCVAEEVGLCYKRCKNVSLNVVVPGFYVY